MEISASKSHTTVTWKKLWPRSKQEHWCYRQRPISTFRKLCAWVKIHVLMQCARRPEDSEDEVKCMRPGIGTLRIFPSIWGRKYTGCQLISMHLTRRQIGRAALEIVRRTSNGLMNSCRNSSRKTLERFRSCLGPSLQRVCNFPTE